LAKVESAGVSSQLLEYLANYASKGTPLSSAKDGLLASGFSEAEINNALQVQPYVSSHLSAASVPSAVPKLPALAQTESTDLTGLMRALLILAILLFFVTVVFLLARASLKPSASATSGSITSADCITENGMIVGGISSRVCQIGSVKLTIID
jgi:hypothetical protein